VWWQPAIGWPSWLAIAVAAAWLLTYTNQFNFMDGSDGLAAGVAVVNAVALSGLAWFRDRPDLATIALIVAAATAGFLWHNFPPASIFMGDAGSHFLGFTLAMLVVFLVEAGFSPLIAAAPLAPFLIDATVTLVRRVRRGEQVWRAHRSHMYQRLLAGGWSPRQVVFAYYGWAAWSALSAWAMMRAAWPFWMEATSVLAAQAVAAGLLALAVGRVEGRASGPAAPRLI
jgi:UDP-N-acetylmuramyl pentapeptide phosphotransferase/UDP-N-acetylglucosamine-1-phosphate transferase